MTFAESIVEQAALAWLDALDYTVSGGDAITESEGQSPFSTTSRPGKTQGSHVFHPFVLGNACGDRGRLLPA